MNTNAISGSNYTTYDAGATKSTKKTTSTYGKTVGKPELSEKAAKYYDELKSKFSDMDFVLVSDKEKDRAEANAAAYANPNKTVVLINESKIEEMANDETARAKYEGILSNANSQLAQMAQQITSTGAEVEGYGIKIDDNGNAKYFAVLKKNSEAQAARIEKRTEEKRAEKKAAEKKAEKEAAQEANEERIQKRAENRYTPENSVTLTANSVEELFQKISDYTYAQKADTVQTEAELAVGQHIDFKG